MASKIFQSPRVDSQTLVDAPIHAADGTSSILAAMKTLSQPHRVLETIIIRAYESSRELPLSGDQELSIVCLVLFLVYCFVVYPLFLCPTEDVPGPYFTSTAVGDQLHGYHKLNDNADQWALSLHEKYGSAVRITPTLVSVNDPDILHSQKAGGKISDLSLKNGTYTAWDGTAKPTTIISTKEEQKRDALLFQAVIISVLEDLRVALKGQKTVDIHDLLSRHLREKAPASFATAVAHTIYQLAHPMHRHYLNRLVKDIQAASDQNMEEIELLNAVVKESLRMQQAPNHHSIILVVGKHGIDLKNHYLQEDFKITTSLYCVARHPALFPRPNDYDPTRWLESDKASENMEEALEFVLDYHRRIKPEFDNTLRHLKILLAKMLESFDMKLPLGEQPKQLDAVALRSGSCRVRFRERKQVVEKKVRFAEHVIM